VRTVALIRGLQARGWAVTVGSPAARNAASASLADGGATVVDAPLNRSPPLAALLAVARPALVIFDKFTAEEAFSHAVREHAPGAARVVDLQDVASLRRARGRAVGEADERAKGAAAPPPPPCLAATAAETSTPPPLSPLHAALAAVPAAGGDPDGGREVAAILRCDAALVCSPLEGALLAGGWGLPPAKLVPAPFFARPLGHRRAVTPVGRSWGDRTHFVMVGHHGHAPNADGLTWLTAPGGAWDAIADACPGAELHVWGAYESAAARGVACARRRILLRGRAPNLSVLGRARVLLAPLRFGAGLKGKVVEAWARGTPVVTTPIGAEGFFPAAASGAAPPGFPTAPDAPGGWWWGGPYGGGVTALPPGAPVPVGCPDAADGRWGGLWTALDAAAFAADAVRLYNDDMLWAACSSRGAALHDALAGRDATLAPVLDALEALAADPASLGAARAADHTGAAFWAAGVRATEYFSRWIELKEAVKAGGGGERGV